jgi:hypothetical protein
MMNIPSHRTPRKRTPSKALFFHGAPDAVCGRAFALPVDVSLSGDFLDWGPEYTAKIRLPETNPYVRKVARPLPLVAHLVQPVVSQRPGLDLRELDRLCSDPAALRAFLAEKQRQIEAFKPKRKAAFAEFSGALSGGL